MENRIDWINYLDMFMQEWKKNLKDLDKLLETLIRILGGLLILKSSFKAWRV